ncbi:MAG: ABC transporter permease subunit [Gammaproteobacteria bacterium]|nr:ABC transporter permease subunit [Gammaproteobacteria bacterium]
MDTPYQIGQPLPISLSLHALPYYSLRTVLRLLIAMLFSLLTTFIFGTLAAKNRHAERIIIPLVDILQSVPVLGFLSITVAGFIALFPHRMLGPECAAIFAVFVAQVWNILLGFYQSLRMLPADLSEAADILQLSPWQRFWRVEVPFAMPSLIWNVMLSMSASWFFIVASEAISVNNQLILLPGIGSYVALAISHANKPAITAAIAAMLVVILLYDQLLFRPLVYWGDRFRIDVAPDEKTPRAWFVSLLRRTQLLPWFGYLCGLLFTIMVNLRVNRPDAISPTSGNIQRRLQRAVVGVWYMAILLICTLAILTLAHFIFHQVTLHEAWHVVVLGGYTALRVISLIIVCSVVWVPIGVWLGMKSGLMRYAQGIVQILAAFPANLLYPIIFTAITTFHLNVNIWVVPLMALGAQWYILFNIIAGTSAIPKDLHYAAKNFSLRGWNWWRRFILPALFPYYITGIVTAAGAAWNASIVAEVVKWGSTTLEAQGLGAYITEFTTNGDFQRIALGIVVMCIYVLVFNRLVWQPLYNLAQKRYALS